MSEAMAKEQTEPVETAPVPVPKETAREAFVKDEDVVTDQVMLGEEEATKEEAKEEEVLPTENKAKIISKPIKEIESKESQPSEQEKIQEEFSKRFAALSKREKFISQKEKEGRERIKRLEELEKLESSIKADPYKAVETFGGTYEDWTKRILNDGNPDPSKEIKEVRQELQSWKDKENETQKELQNQRRIETFQSELTKIDSYMNENIESLPRINLYSDSQLVFDIRAEKFRQDVENYGQEEAKKGMLSIEDAAQMAEDYRIEFLKNKKEKLKHFQKIFGDTEVSEEKAALAAEDQKLPDKPSKTREALPERTRRILGLRTLTNKQQTTVPAKSEKREFRNDTERAQHAASFLKWT